MSANQTAPLMANGFALSFFKFCTEVWLSVMRPLLCLYGTAIFPEITLGTLVKLLQLLEAMSWQVSPPVVTDSVFLLHSRMTSAVVGGTGYTTILNHFCCCIRGLASPCFSWLQVDDINTYLPKRVKPCHWYYAPAFYFLFCITLKPCTMTLRPQNDTFSPTYYPKDWDHDGLLMTYK